MTAAGICTLDGLVGLSGFRCIVADPPWPVRQPPREWKTGTANAPLPYRTMTVDEIKAMPVASIAAKSAHIYVWTVNRFVRDTYDVLASWGFTPAMLLTWCKTPMGIGPGRQYASTTEFVLFGWRGPQEREPERIERNWWNWPRGRHSEKPEAFQDIVERVSPGPRIELFARRLRLGWTVWGNEVEANAEGESRAASADTVRRDVGAQPR